MTTTRTTETGTPVHTVAMKTDDNGERYAEIDLGLEPWAVECIMTEPYFRYASSYRCVEAEADFANIVKVWASQDVFTEVAGQPATLGFTVCDPRVTIQIDKQREKLTVDLEPEAAVDLAEVLVQYAMLVGGPELRAQLREARTSETPRLEGGAVSARGELPHDDDGGEGR